jgi:hypothetical protein
VIHLGDEVGEHAFSLLALALQVLHDPSFAFSENDVNGYRVLLTKPPAAADGLVVLLETMGRKVGDVAALLEVQTPCSDLGLGDQHAGAPLCKINQSAFFLVVTI